MCDRCLDSAGVRRLLGVDHLPDAVTRAANRLRCYYECVTQDTDIFEEDEEDLAEDDLEAEDYWEPEM